MDFMVGAWPHISCKCHEMTNSAPQFTPGNFQSCLQKHRAQNRGHCSISLVSRILPKTWASSVTDLIQDAENSARSLHGLSLTYLSSFTVGYVYPLSFSHCGWPFTSLNILHFTCHRTFVFTGLFFLWCNLFKDLPMTGPLLFIQFSVQMSPSQRCLPWSQTLWSQIKVK